MIAPLGFLSVLALYLSTLYPSIAPEDSGEFVAAAWTLGIPHASGYSLYALLGKTAALLVPWGNPAYRVNFLSAALGAGAALLWADTLPRLLPASAPVPNVLLEMERSRWRRAGTWTAALLWASVPGVWYLSILAEVYGLELFLGAVVFWSGARWLDQNAWSKPVFMRRWGLSSLLVGAGAALHHTFVLWVPGLLALLWARLPSKMTRPPLPLRNAPAAPRGRWGALKPLLGIGVLFAAVGFSIQLSLYFRSITVPLLDTGSPDNLTRWLRVVLRQDYGTFSLFKEPAEGARLAGTGIYLKSLTDAFTPFGILFALWGAYRLWRNSRALFGTAFLLWLVPGPVFLGLTQPPLKNHFLGVIERFYPLSFIGVLIFLAWGLYDAGVTRAWLRRLALTLVPLSVILHVYVSGRGNLHARDFGANLLKSMPLRSVLWDPGDSAAYAALYHQSVLGQRNDVASVHYHTTLWGQRQLRRRYPDLMEGNGTDGFQQDFLARILAGSRKEWIFAEVPRSLPGVDPRDRSGLSRRYPEDGFPLGLAYRYFPSETHKLVDPRSQLSLGRLTFWRYRQSTPRRLWGTAPVSPESFAARDRFTAEILRRYPEAHTNLGQKFGEYGIRDLAEQEYFVALSLDPRQMEAFNNLGVLATQDGKHGRAAAFFRRAIENDPQNASLRSNLGYAYAQAGRIDEALEAFRSTLRLDPVSREALYQTADLLEKQGRPTEALALWKRQRDLDPDAKDVYWRLSRAYAALNQPGKALETLSEYFLLPLTDQEKVSAEEFRRTLPTQK